MLKGVLETLLRDGVALVATSNRAPWELNQQGLQEDLFLHFVSRLVDACDVVALGDGAVDYRQVRTSALCTSQQLAWSHLGVSVEKANSALPVYSARCQELADACS